MSAHAEFLATRETWDRVLHDHYFTPVPDPFAGIGAVFAVDVDPSLHLQIVTHLEALDYLAPFLADALPPARQWQPALAAFRHDLALALADDTLTLTVGADETSTDLSPDERTLRQLKAVCSFEGEVHFTTWPPPPGLPTRLAAHRLRAFGLLELDAPLPPQPAPRWSEVSIALAAPDLLTLLNWLGDTPELTSHFLLTQRNHAFAFSGDPTQVPALLAAYHIQRPNTKGRRRTSIRNRHRPPPRRSREAPKILPAGLQPGPTAAPPSLALNAFALHLLQVRLWMFGYYAGALDGHWGPMILGALRQFFAEHHDSRQKSPSLAAFSRWCRIEPPEETAGAIDLCHLLSYLVETHDEGAEATSRQEIDELVQQTLDPGRDPAAVADAETTITTDLLAAHHERRTLQQTDRAAADQLRTADATAPRRRRYFGWRAIFGFLGRALQWIGRTIRQTVRWLRERIRRLLHYATAFLNYLRETTRRAVKLVSLGLQRLWLWVSGQPITTTHPDAVAATQWSLDFDTLNVVLGRPDPTLVQAHTDRLRALNAGFGFLLEVTVAVWDLVRAFTLGTLNWLLAAWRVFKTVRALLSSANEHADLLARLQPAVV